MNQHKERVSILDKDTHPKYLYDFENGYSLYITAVNLISAYDGEWFRFEVAIYNPVDVTWQFTNQFISFEQLQDVIERVRNA